MNLSPDMNCISVYWNMNIYNQAVTAKTLAGCIPSEKQSANIIQIYISLNTNYAMLFSV